MRKLLFTALLVGLFGSCKKNVDSLSKDGVLQLDKVTAYLKSELSPTDYGNLSFAGSDVTSIDSGRILLWRIPFTGKPLSMDFVLVQGSSVGPCTAGRIIHLDRTPGELFLYNGTISIQTLHRAVILQSNIDNGYITALHPSGAIHTIANEITVEVVPASAGGDVLPEVVIVGYINSTGTAPNEQSYMNLLTLMAASPDGGGGGGSGSGAGSGGGGSGGSAPGTTTSPVGGGSVNLYTAMLPSGSGAPSTSNLSRSLLASTIQVKAEYQYSLPVENIAAIMRCFNLVPSAGATYSISICADVPVNSSPLTTVNPFSSNAQIGHSFLIAKKTNGSASVTQSFGFYPATTPSIWNPFGPVASAIKDNGNQEINAELTMTVTAAQFNTFAAAVTALAAHAYTLDSFNCTDFAVRAVNSVRSSPLEVPPYTIYLPAGPNGDNVSTQATPLTIPNSPQGLYELLAAMKMAGGPEAGNTVTDLTHNTKSPASHGQCN
jgi:hypothetical protein